MNIDRLQEPYVLLLIGPPLVGKSTWIKNTFGDKQITIVSRDQIMLDLHSGVNDYQSAYKNQNPKEIARALKKSLQDAADSGENVIVDMTNLVAKRRKDTLKNFGEEYNKIAVIFPIPEWSDLMKRNDKRKEEENKFIPLDVLKNMLSMYQPIRKEEGFDKVVSI
jgi:predicted kinase